MVDAREEFPFPLTGRYEVAAGLRPLGEVVFGRREAGHFEDRPDLASALMDRLAVLRAHPEAVRCLDPEADREALAGAVWQVLSVLAAEHPERVRMAADRAHLVGPGVTVTPTGEVAAAGSGAPEAQDIRAHLLSQRGLEALADAVGLTAAEDWAVVRADPEGGDRAELLHVAFPGHWDPRDKVGRSFVAIHRPVAHNEKLIRAQAALVRAMMEKGPFVRFVWGVTTTGRLPLNPCLPEGRAPALSAAVLDDPAAVARACWLRVERQTTRPLGGGRALFTIGVRTAPVTEAAASPERRRLLADSLDSMDADALAYKGLTGIRDPLVAWLRAP